MSRRLFLKNLTVLVSGLTLPAAAHARLATHKTLQHSPIAGFQYHEGEAVWADLALGQPLQLIREPENKYDDRAVRVEFNGQKLGYLPRLDNAAVSQLLDRGENIQAVISELKVSEDPWERVRVEVGWMIN